MNCMFERCQSVIRSDVARALVLKERVEQSRTFYCDHITEAVLKNETNAVTNSSSLSNTATSAAAKRTISLDSAQQSNKKPRRLNASYLKALSCDKQLQCLAEHYGKNSLLDLTSPGAIPVRFAKAKRHTFHLIFNCHYP
ncbi:uncharacterized protein EV154DRAFT_603026 [Mucor mucedo]|uniref:uncharacterized protein n=1 Tax=Mucor mucedo TaxID=29922 RepID=UPI002220AD1C|nr:uncharacterized protein EV154DRAFT_603026 [Mucor mucedo]KAI7890658.1 hypothetical protein EV154DRAFT_603026 [Mucor mucedo]